MPPRKTYRPVEATGPLTLGDHRRHPASRLLLTCSLCGWTRTYSAERCIDRLRQLRAGGHATEVGRLAARVAWPCPGCHRIKWRTDLAQPADLDPREARRLAGLYRN
jgi:hypothetical protein